MASLYEIDKSIEQIIEHGFAFDEETGEITFDVGDLDDLEAAFVDKLENCGLYVKNLKAMADAIKNEEAALAKRRKMLEGKIDRMNGYILPRLLKIDGTKVETPRVILSTRKSKSCNVYRPDKVPAEFKETVQTEKVKKAEIAKAIKAGKTVPGAEIVENINLQIK